MKVMHNSQCMSVRLVCLVRLARLACVLRARACVCVCVCVVYTPELLQLWANELHT